VTGVELVGLVLLLISPVLDVSEGEVEGDGDIFDAGNIEVPSLEESFSDEFWDMAMAEDGQDLLGAIPGLLALGLGQNRVLVDLLPQFAH
jgi:hypothetical protein